MTDKITTQEQIKHLQTLMRRQQDYLSKCRNKELFLKVQHEKDITETILWTVKNVEAMKNAHRSEK